MACKECRKNAVWEFTNKTKLCRKCFADYFERKIFRTIRKYNLLPKTIILKKSNDINTKVLRYILEKKFPVKSGKENLSSKNLSQTADEIFSNIMKGRFKFRINKTPLMLLSDREIGLYAQIKKIKGNKIKKDKKIKKLFKKFMKKNPDLEHNILNAYFQLN